MKRDTVERLRQECVDADKEVFAAIGYCQRQDGTLEEVVRGLSLTRGRLAEIHHHLIQELRETGTVPPPRQS